jgi:hypothetical protein
MTGFGALELLARAGFLVKGVVYMVVGALTLQVAAHLGGTGDGDAQRLRSGPRTTVRPYAAARRRRWASRLRL